MPTFPQVAAVALALSLGSSVCAAKHDAWVEVRSPNFVVVSNAGEKQARKSASQFEQIRAVFRQSLEVARAYPSPRVTVLAVKDETSMRELLPEYWVKGHAHPAGMFASGFNLFFAAVELDAHGSNPYSTFYHEYYHAITTPYFPDLPLWLSEGLAEYFGHTNIEDKYVELGQQDTDSVRQLWNATLIPLNALFKVERSSPYYNEADKTSLFYAESWALAHYLMIGDRGAHKPMLAAYLDALNHGKNQDDAAAAFGDLKQLESALQSYIHQTAFLYSKYPAPAIDDDKMKVRPLSEAEVDAYRAGFAILRNRVDDANHILAEALHLDPNIALTYQYLSLTQLLAGQRVRALESASKAISLDPGNPLARYMRAFLVSSGSGMKSGDSQIEEDLRQAIAASPGFAPPYSLLALYLATVNRNLREALTLAQKAIALEPANSNYQLSLGQVLVRMKRLSEADHAAARARAWAREPQEKKNAADFTAYLQEVHENEDPILDIDSEIASAENTQAGASSASVNPDLAVSSGSRTSPKAELRAAPPAAIQMQASINILSSAFGLDFAPYLKHIMDAVRKNLAASVSRGFVTHERSLSLEFAILKDGTIAALKVASSSGDAALDRAAQDIMAASSPLPGLPREFRGESLTLHFGLTYSPQNSQ